MSGELIIPIADVPSQTVSTSVGNQSVTFNIYQKSTGLYVDVICPSMLYGGLYGVSCLNGVRIIRNTYFGFVGDFIFYDIQSPQQDPSYPGIGTRYLLVYLPSAA